VQVRILKKSLRYVAIGIALLAEGGILSAQNGAPMPNGGNARLVKEVRHELVMLPYYGVFDDLSYQVNGNNVVLMGEVTRPTLKSDAENAVKHIEGVGQVVNEIKVLPLSPMDDRIRRETFRAIYGRGQLADRYGFQAVPSIHILVDNGHVTLTGVVDSEMDKNIAGVQANSVPGVFSVTNNLRVGS
jgi:hyperosmotically inducible protein